ncbi:MAG: hypothetical protein ACREMP_10510 [Candidatus Tyrphobacter sp.]
MVSWDAVQRHSILGEVGWLVYFIVLLIVAVYAMNFFVDAVFPRHFNDKIADAIAAILACVAFLATRTAASRQR